MNKKSISLLLVTALMIVLLTACGGSKTAEPSAESSTETEESANTNTSNTAKNKKAPDVAVQFANALCDEDYEVILNLLYLPENSVVSADEIQEFLQRSSLANFLGGDYVEISDYKEYDTSIVTTMTTGSDTCEVDFVLDANGNFALQMQAGWAERQIIAPSGATIKINGVTLDEASWSETYTKNDDNQELVLYTLICPVTDFSAHVTTDIESYDIDIIYNTDTKPYSVVNYNISESILTDICEDIKTNLNDIFNTIDSGNTNVTALQPYFASTMSNDIILEMIEWYQNMETSVDVTIVEPDDREDYQSYICSNNDIQMFVKFESSWAESKTHHGYATFMITNENGSYQIKETKLYEDSFFTNHFDMQW